METKEIVLTPNFASLFRNFSREARFAVERACQDAETPAELEPLADVLPPLLIAIQSATTTQEIIELRRTLETMVQQVSATRAKLEHAEANDENELPNEEECDCADRSWYGDVHDSACPLAGEPRS